MNFKYKEVKDNNLSKLSKNERDKRKAINAFRIAYELSSLDLYLELRKMRKDILFIYGSKDSLLSIKPIESIFGLITNIHLAIFEDVRHYIFTFDLHKLARKIDLFFSDNKV
jgi:pimeloyl-ACP methyl ester carboxylesterase